MNNGDCKPSTATLGDPEVFRSFVHGSLSMFCEHCFTNFGFPFGVLDKYHYDWCKLLQTEQKLNLIVPKDYLGKSLFLASAYPIWRLGNNPELKIGIIKPNMDLALHHMNYIKVQINDNKNLRQIFPDLKLSYCLFDNAAIVNDTLYSIEVLGTFRRFMNNKLDIIIVDDMFVHDDDAKRCIAKTEWFNNVIMKHLSDRCVQGQCVVISSTQYEYDLSYHLVKDSEWTSVKMDTPK